MIKNILIVILLISGILVADEWKVSHSKENTVYKIENQNKAIFEISCNKSNSSVSLINSRGTKNSTNVYAISTVDNKRRTFSSPLNVKNVDDISNWNELLVYLETASNFYVASSIGGFYFKPINAKSELKNIVETCTQFVAGNNKNNSKNKLPLIKPEKPMEIYVKTSKIPKNALFEIYSLDNNLTINSVIVNGGKCDNSLMPVVRENRIVNKNPRFPLDLEKFDSLEVMAWECRTILELKIETNYGSYFYNLE